MENILNKYTFPISHEDFAKMCDNNEVFAILNNDNLSKEDKKDLISRFDHWRGLTDEIMYVDNELTTGEYGIDIFLNDKYMNTVKTPDLERDVIFTFLAANYPDKYIEEFENKERPITLEEGKKVLNEITMSLNKQERQLITEELSNIAKYEGIELKFEEYARLNPPNLYEMRWNDYCKNYCTSSLYFTNEDQTFVAKMSNGCVDSLYCDLLTETEQIFAGVLLLPEPLNEKNPTIKEIIDNLIENQNCFDIDFESVALMDAEPGKMLYEHFDMLYNKNVEAENEELG